MNLIVSIFYFMSPHDLQSDIQMIASTDFLISHCISHIPFPPLAESSCFLNTPRCFKPVCFCIDYFFLPRMLFSLYFLASSSYSLWMCLKNIFPPPPVITCCEEDSTDVHYKTVLIREEKRF